MESPEGAHWILIGLFDSLKVPLICHVIDLIQKGKVIGKSYLDFAFDLLEASNKQEPKIFNQITSSPATYIRHRPLLR